MIKKNFTEERVLMWVPLNDRRNYIQASDAEVREILMPLHARELADVIAALDDADVPKNDSVGRPMTLAERVVWSMTAHCTSSVVNTVRDATDAHQWLYDRNVPELSPDGRKELSLVERIELYAMRNAELSAGHRTLDAAGVPTQLNGNDMSIADRIGWLASKH